MRGSFLRGASGGLSFQAPEVADDQVLLGRGTGEHDPPLLQHDDVIDHAQGFVDVLLDEQPSITEAVVKSGRLTR